MSRPETVKLSSHQTTSESDISPHSVEPSTRANRRSTEGVPTYQLVNSKKENRHPKDVEALKDQESIPCMEPKILDHSQVEYHEEMMPATKTNVLDELPQEPPNFKLAE